MCRRAETARGWFLSFDETQRLAEALCADPDQRAAGIIRLCMLTGARCGEARTATFDQFNLDLAIWTKQAAYTKQRRVHRVPISHEAVTLIRLRGKLVLWFLCDRYTPDFGCFPTQARLAEDAEMSISALNAHLATLENLRLIHRIRAHDPHSHRRLPTRYILGFEQGFPQKAPPESGDGFVEITAENDTPSSETTDGAISGFPGFPSPDFAQSHLRNPECNLVREPLTNPVQEEEDAPAREIDFDRFFAEMLTARGLDPNGTLPAWWQGWPARTHVRRWCDDLGLSEDQIIGTATETRRDHPAPPDGPKALDRAMEHAARRDAQTAGKPPSGKRQPKPNDSTRPSDDEKAAFDADMVNSDRYLPANTISTTIREAMLARGLVTPERLRARDVR